MRPYQKLAITFDFSSWRACALICSLITCGAVAPAAQRPVDKPSAQIDSAEALTRGGVSAYYNTNYEEAIRAFQRVTELRPDDPAAWNHLLEAEIFRELYRVGALNSTLYAGDSFIKSRA